MQHAGETVLIRVKVARAKLGKVVHDGTVIAEFWAPGRDPQNDPEARDHPDYSAECFWDGDDRAWSAHVLTEGWAPGTWAVRCRAATVTELGDARGWGWGTLQLAA